MEKLSDCIVSIILPVFNGQRFIDKAIRSCLSQSHERIELIIVNDGSTDDSLSIAQNFAALDKRVRIINNRTNLKLPASLNKGHHKAEGKFITWISHDNFFAPTAIEEMLKFLVKENADLVFTDFAILNEGGQEIGKNSFDGNSTLLLENIVRASFLYRKEVFDRNAGYDEDLFKIEDYAFWLMASTHSTIRHLPRELYYYRRHSESLTSAKTIAIFQYERTYVQRVFLMYLKFFMKIGVPKPAKIADIFSKLHLHQELDVEVFLKSFTKFRNALGPVLKFFEQQQVFSEMDIRLRSNILRYRSNQNPQVLFWLILRRPNALFSSSVKKTFRIIYKTLFSKT